MIKKEANIMQEIFCADEIEVSIERRNELAIKGRRLYGKYCGTDGKGICAESFVEYHIWRGELAVARDFLAFLQQEVEALRQGENQERLVITERLINRIQMMLGVMTS